MPIVPNLLFIGVGGVMLWQILTAPPGRLPQPGDPGPWALPTVLAVLMIVLGCVEVLRGLRTRPLVATPNVSDADIPAPADGEGSGVTSLAPPNWPVRLIFVVALIGYVLLFTQAGFTVATFAFLAVAITTLGGMSLRRLGSAILIGAIASLSIGWLLAGIVGVPLPGVLLLP